LRSVKLRCIGLTLIGLLITPSMVSALNFYQEDRLAKQLVSQLKTGKAIRLKAGEHKFLALYTESRTVKSRGGIVLIHDYGAHPDWQMIIGPLRNKLPDYGWNTLSLHMPFLSKASSEKKKAALHKEALKRITAARKFFGEKGIYNLILIGHSLGALVGLTYLATDSNKDGGFIAFVGVAMVDHHSLLTKFYTPNLLTKINLPILDIFGNLDSTEVLLSAKQRNSVAKKSYRVNFQQLKIIGADHFFTGLETTLITRLRAWLNKQAPSMEIEGKKGKR
jgi:alpha/beta superfamily hydrolase